MILQCLLQAHSSRSAFSSHSATRSSVSAAKNRLVKPVGFGVSKTDIALDLKDSEKPEGISV